MQLSWGIYQTRIFSETKKLTSKLLERRMQHDRDLFENNDRVYFSIALEQVGYYYGH